MKNVLVTGFEPFGGEGRNPSQEIARALDGRTIGGRRVVGATLPCAFGTARHELVRLLRVHDPSLVICVGLASGRAEVTPERIAINVDDARIADNEGAQPIDTPVIRGGPAAYWTRLPIKAIVAALREKEIPSAVSQTAGTFVCNHVFYALMHALRWQRQVRGGFIHVPLMSEQVSDALRPHQPLATLVDAIAIAVEVSVHNRRDVRHGGGQTE